MIVEYYQFLFELVKPRSCLFNELVDIQMTFD